MKRLAQTFLISTLLSFTLSACGGGSGDAVNTPPAQPVSPSPTPPGQNPPDAIPPDENPPPNTDPYVIDYHGDSTIWGWASGSDGARVAVPAPQTFADALPTPPQNVVRNEGVNGSTACDLLEGRDGINSTWSEQMQASNATHVIVNHGINDQSRYDIARYRSCLGALVSGARERGKQIVFETPNPVAVDALLAYVEAMRAVAAEQQPPVPVIDQHQYLMDYLDGRSVNVIVPDGVHPSEEAYRLKGEFAAQRFTALFPR